MTAPLRVGISPCPNDTYVFAGLILGKVSWEAGPCAWDYQDVETCNEATRRGLYDVAKISYANYPAVADEYELLDCGGALGRGVGPLLLANGADRYDPEREVWSPGRHTTANFLLDFYLGRRVEKRFLLFDALYDELRNQRGAQGVVIHEKRFTYERDGLTLLADLGEHWERETGYAIPLGAIVARRSLGRKAELEAGIRRSLDWAEAREAETLDFCRQYAQELSDDVMRAHIGLYVNQYTRDLGDEGRAAVDFFLKAVGDD
jgi:1,4-dihydroxy-6-naphthoate synthase